MDSALIKFNILWEIGFFHDKYYKCALNTNVILTSFSLYSRLLTVARST